MYTFLKNYIRKIKKKESFRNEKVWLNRVTAFRRIN